MKVTTQGTTNSVKWCQPESADECQGTDCRKCVYFSYIPSNSSCPFEAWMINHPVEKPTHMDNVQAIIDQTNRLSKDAQHLQTEPLKNMIEVVDLLTTLSLKSKELGEILQEQSVPSNQSNVPTWFLPSMENADDDMHGRDYYHHCPGKNNKLVRLNFSDPHKFHYCPACQQTFKMK